MILITGSSGFLGKFLKRHISTDYFTLGRNNAHIICFLENEIPDCPPTDLVIHAAGKAHSIPKTATEAQEFFDVNVNGTLNLLKGLEKAPKLPDYFVFVSSVAVYGVETGHLITEDTPLLAEDPYGKSKIQAEKIIENWCAKNNVVCTILRLPLLAGPNPPGNLKAMIKGIKKGYYFNIAGGKAKKSMVLAEDVAIIIPMVAKIGGVYNLTDGYHPTFGELSKCIAKQINRPEPGSIPFFAAKIVAGIGDLIGNRAPVNSQKLNKITANLTFDDSKAVNAFGWDPTPVLKGFQVA